MVEHSQLRWNSCDVDIKGLAEFIQPNTQIKITGAHFCAPVPINECNLVNYRLSLVLNSHCKILLTRKLAAAPKAANSMVCKTLL